MAESLRLGVVGCGRVFERFHLPALMRSPTWTVSALCDSSPVRLERFRGLGPDVRLFSSAPDMLDTTGLDAVLVATPPATHAAITAQALRRGCSVLVEKPMALTADQAVDLAEIAERTGAVLWVGYNRRFAPGFRSLRSALRNPALGAIDGVSSRFISDATGWRSVSGFLGDDARGGGVLDDIGSHQLDLIAWLTGDSPIEVRARPIVDEGRLHRSFRIDLRLAGGQTVECVSGHGRRQVERIRITAGRRTLVAGLEDFVDRTAGNRRDPWRSSRLGGLARAVLRRLRGRESPILETFVRQYREFAQAVRHEPVAAPGADASAGLAVACGVEACHRSLASGGDWVAVQQVARNAA